MRIQVCNAIFPLKYSSRVHITHPLLFDGRKLYCVIKNSNRLSQKTTIGKDNRDRAGFLLPRLSSTRLDSKKKKKKEGKYFQNNIQVCPIGESGTDKTDQRVFQIAIIRLAPFQQGQGKLNSHCARKQNTHRKLINLQSNSAIH